MTIEVGAYKAYATASASGFERIGQYFDTRYDGLMTTYNNFL